MLKDITNFFTKKEVVENIIQYKNENLERFLHSSKIDLFNFIADSIKDTFADVTITNGNIIIRGGLNNE